MIYISMVIMPLIVGFGITNILQIRDSNEHPSSWWKCGVYCTFIWWFLLNWYNFVVIRTKVRMIPDFYNFHPHTSKMLYSWIIVGSQMMGTWIFEYYVNNRRLHYLQGPYSAVLGLALGPILQCKLLLPRSISRVQF